MRLSLKTILAYSDNLFDTEYRPVIEKRIGKEGMAGHLIDRIRSVVRSPDIPVPGRHGEKDELSANLVAAYLDSQLSDTEQSQFETICLRSDVFLAEVACTHQILTTILGQPAKLSRDCRLRLYAVPRHRKVPYDDNPLNHEQDEDIEQEMIEPQADTEPRPSPCKKRRITVTAEPEAGKEKREEERDSEPQAIECAIEPDSGSLASYLSPLTSSVGKISRLGQAFAHQKRHRLILMVSSLALLFGCMSMYLIAHLHSRQQEREIVQHRPHVPASGILKPEDETNNDQRFDDHRGLWGPRDTATPSGSSDFIVPVGGLFADNADTLYSMQESPKTVIQYLPGDTPVGVAMNGPPTRPPSVAPSNPQLSTATSVAMVEASPQIQQRLPQQSVQNLQPSSAQQNPMQQPYPQAASNVPNTRAALPMQGTASVNGLTGGHKQSNVQFVDHDRMQPLQPAQRHPESIIQLIDRGNVPSVNQFINPSLPAVQPPTWGTGDQSNPTGQDSPSRVYDQTTFPYYMRTPVPNPSDGTLLSDRTIEQASFTNNPRPPDLSPPLIEPVVVESNWTEYRNDSFEQLSDAPRVPAHRNASPPLRLPDNASATSRAANTSHGAILKLDTEDLALVRATPDAEWSWLPVSKQLVNDIVLIPAPFRAAIQFPNGIVVETEGDTRVQILPNDEAGRPSLAFDCGHLTIYATGTRAVHSGISQSLRIVTPVGGGVLRLTDTSSLVTINAENKTTVKLLKVTRPYESVTANPVLSRSLFETNVVYCPNLITFPANGKTVFWQKDGHADEWKLNAVSIFPMDVDKSTDPILLYNASHVIVTPVVVWPSLVSHDGRIPISKLDLKNQFVTMPHTFYPTPSKIWLLQ
ncbi:MAG: hypothetical protein FWD31_03130 [Planctomycetaceae bacterium]|nr:hypothetical protein [Planctomycetaceae bacterium]